MQYDPYTGVPLAKFLELYGAMCTIGITTGWTTEIWIDPQSCCIALIQLYFNVIDLANYVSLREENVLVFGKLPLFANVHNVLL